ncbi:MAG TPA: stage II sporulation protein M [Gemmatimonadaceae bacterium]|nr:stage II sporulation protein M [Gemmatimonadaceae bacterium]
MTFPESSSTGRPARSVASFDQQVDVETPEQVVLSYTLAGIGARAVAAIVDAIALSLIIYAVLVSMSLLVKLAPSGSKLTPEASSTFAIAIVILVIFGLEMGYYVLFEALWDGQTPGKRLLRIRVVQDGGYSVSFGASAVRNIARIVDGQPGFLYGVGVIAAALNKSGKRLGDMMAGTFVVQERVEHAPVVAAVAPSSDSAAPAIASLSASEYELLERFLSRAPSLAPERLALLADRLSVKLAPHMPNDALPLLDRLRILYAREREARSRGLAARGAKGAARERHAIVARSSARWSSFAALLRDAQRRGLRHLSETEVSDFVAQYREIATDLARLTTASRDTQSDALFYLSRLVAGGHNLLYRQRSVTGSAALRFVAVNVPREMRRSWGYIAIAALCLFGPMAVAYQAVVNDPLLAEALLPPGMIDRANEGVARAKTGDRTYVEIKSFMRPIAASSIIANNIQVTYTVFVFGITFGLGTLLMLVTNGVSIGAALGLYQSKGILPQIGEFVLSHSVFELSAICIAGAGGLLIARALLLPGVYTRREALVVYGRRAVRLITASTLLLIVAGTIEGLISPRTDIPVTDKIVIAAVSALVLLVYFLLGGRGMGAADEEQFAYSEARALSSR